MLWHINRGFLPITDPIQFLSINKFEDTELIYTWENLAENIPSFLKQECLREEMTYILRKSSNAYYFGFLDGFKNQEMFERAFLLLSFFANSYVNASEGGKKKKLPKEIAIPLCRAAHLVHRKPVLDYTSFCLYNWKIKDKNKDITAANVDMLNTFTDSQEERYLFSKFVEFEYSSRVLFNNITPELIYNFICNQNAMLADVHHIKNFCGYFEDFENLVYEGCSSQPLNYDCNLLLQSPTLHLLYKYLDIGFKSHYLKAKFGILSVPESHNLAILGVRPIKSRQNKLYRDTLLELIELNEKLVLSESDRLCVSIMNDEIIGSLGD